MSNIKLAFMLGAAWGMGKALGMDHCLAQDSDKWITVKPNGSENKGRPVLIDGETGEVKGGMGNKFNGKNIRQNWKQNNKPEQSASKKPVSREKSNGEVRSATAKELKDIRQWLYEAKSPDDSYDSGHSRWVKETMDFMQNPKPFYDKKYLECVSRGIPKEDAKKLASAETQYEFNKTLSAVYGDIESEAQVDKHSKTIDQLKEKYRDKFNQGKKIVNPSENEESSEALDRFHPVNMKTDDAKAASIAKQKGYSEDFVNTPEKVYLDLYNKAIAKRIKKASAAAYADACVNLARAEIANAVNDGNFTSSRLSAYRMAKSAWESKYPALARIRYGSNETGTAVKRKATYSWKRDNPKIRDFIKEQTNLDIEPFIDQETQSNRYKGVLVDWAKMSRVQQQAINSLVGSGKLRMVDNGGLGQILQKV